MVFSIKKLLKKSGMPFFVIAGPCVIESYHIVLDIAKRLKYIQESSNIPFIFKASFDKANRQHIDSFRGPGLHEGLKILAKVKEATGLPICTDVHETYQIKSVAQVADVIQIPAFLCRQTDLIVEAAKTGKIVNIKKGQMCSPKTMLLAAQKIKATNTNEFMITERGSMFGYNDLIVDPRNLPILRESGAIVVQDVTHSIQRPGCGLSSDGNPKFISTIARMAAAVGVNGFFFETHVDPKSALSDGSNMISIEDLPFLLDELYNISKASRALENSNTS